MEMTQHDFLKVVFVLQGAGSYHTQADSTPCEHGDLIVVPIGQRHRLQDEEGKPMSLYVLSVRPSVCEVAAFQPTLLPSGLLRLNPLAASKVEGSIRRLLFEQTLEQPQSGAVVVSLALRLLTDLLRVSQKNLARGASKINGDRSDSLTRMRGYVDELDDHFFEATNLDEAAMGLGISRRRFTQLFRQVTGTSWLAYVRRLRVEHAQRLLEQTERTVLSIAFECGFEDLSTFYRAFKREVGESPNQWRTMKQSSK
ncbi:MAG: AraC family transcriptional regulator [bacterium]|nr:AraC family transcriptional regulator [bacterium]